MAPSTLTPRLSREQLAELWGVSISAIDKLSDPAQTDPPLPRGRAGRKYLYNLQLCEEWAAARALEPNPLRAVAEQRRANQQLRLESRSKRSRPLSAGREGGRR